MGTFVSTECCILPVMECSLQKFMHSLHYYLLSKQSVQELCWRQRILSNKTPPTPSPPLPHLPTPHSCQFYSEVSACC